MGLTRVTGPVEEPLMLEEVRLHLRVTGTDDDFLLQGLIEAARDWAEDFTHRRFITQTWDWTADEWSTSPFYVPYPPLQSVTSITYIDSGGAEQTLTGSPIQFDVDITSTPGRIGNLYGESWPSLRGDAGGVAVRFVAGYGLAAAVPRVIKLAMLLHIEAHHDRDERTMKMLLQAAESLLWPYKVLTV